MADYPVTKEPLFKQTIRKFEADDPAHADLFNETVQQLLDNDNMLHNGIAGMEAITTEDIDALDGSSGGSSGGGSVSGSEITTEDIDKII